MHVHAHAHITTLHRSAASSIGENFGITGANGVLYISWRTGDDTARVCVCVSRVHGGMGILSKCFDSDAVHRARSVVQAAASCALTFVVTYQ